MTSGHDDGGLRFGMIPTAISAILREMWNQNMLNTRFMEERGADPFKALDTWASIIMLPHMEALVEAAASGTFVPHGGMAKAKLRKETDNLA